MPYNKKLNILIVAARYPGYGGIERVTTQLANHWALSHNVVIASLIQQELTLLQQLSPQVKFVTFPYGGVNYSKENVAFLNNLTAQKNINILIYQDSYFPCQYLIKEAKGQNLRIVIVEHSCPNGFEKEYEQSKRQSLINRLKGWINLKKSIRAEYRNRNILYDSCDRYVLLAKEYIPICQRLGKISNKDKFEVIGNPISLIPPAVVDLRAKKNECIFVGRMDPVKGLGRLLRIWSRVEQELRDWHLIIVGDGVEMAMLKDTIELLDLKRVNLEGYQKHVENYYKRAKIFCMCSTYEGFPMVLPEAMAYGVVPIAFNSFDAYSTIITDGVNGVAVEPYDEDKYASKLISLMKNITQLTRMQNECLLKACNFIPDAIYALWDKIFYELIIEK